MAESFKNSPVIADILSRLSSVESAQGSLPTPTEYDTKNDLRAETNYQNGDRALVSELTNGNVYIYAFNDSVTDPDNDNTILIPDDITYPAPGRWVADVSLSIVGHTHDDKADKMPSPSEDKFLVSDSEGNPQEHATGPGDYATADHNHDSDYAASDHNHDGDYATPDDLNDKMNKLQNVAAGEIGGIPFIRQDGHLDKSAIKATYIPTQDEKEGILGLTGADPAARVSQINANFLGKYISLAALQTAHPTANDGNYAIVDPGAGTDAKQYIWDAEEGWVPSDTTISDASELAFDNSGSDLTSTNTEAAVKEVNSKKIGVSEIPVDDIEIGEQKILTVKKNASSEPEIGDPINLIDKLASQSLLSQLGDDADWGNVVGKSGDFIKLTGDNSDGQLGENSQELYDDNGQYFLCISHILDNPGETTWVRNRNRDALKIGVTQDDAIITDLETETGWNGTTNIKLITTRSKVGSWHKSDVTGYLYHCYKEVDTNADDIPDIWYWYRGGLPSTDDMQILNTGNYVNLVTALGSHNWSTGAYDPSGLGGGDEKGMQGQEYYDETNRKLYKCLYDGTKLVWEQVSLVKS